MSLSVKCYGVLLSQNKMLSAVPVTHKLLTNFALCRQNSLCIQRLLSTDENSSRIDSDTSIPQFGPSDKFVTIYKYPYIKYVSLIGRSKNILLNTLPVALTVSFGIHYVGLISITPTYALAIMGIFLGIPIYLLAVGSKNTVGFIYASQDASTVQIAYIDSDGRRKDVVIPTSDIIPLLETPQSITDKFYCRIMRYSKPKSEVFKMDTSHGQILDKDHFYKVFGIVLPH